MDQDKIGLFIKNIRLENHLTQKELADKLGVTYQAVSKWENGKNIPDISILKQISKDFNVNIDEILNGEKNYTKKNSLNLLFIFIPIIILLGVIIIELNKDNDFVFKTITTECSDFKITGSAAYNKEKASIYVSNIEFCGRDNNEEYKTIECVLYETINDTKKVIRTCDVKNNISLEEYLKDTNIKVDNYVSVCRNLKEESLSLEIIATSKEEKRTSFVVPLKLEDNCE